MKASLLRSMGLLDRSPCIDSRQIDLLAEQVLSIALAEDDVKDLRQAKLVKKTKIKVEISRWIQRNIN